MLELIMLKKINGGEIVSKKEYVKRAMFEHRVFVIERFFSRIWFALQCVAVMAMIVAFSFMFVLGG